MHDQDSSGAADDCLGNVWRNRFYFMDLCNATQRSNINANRIIAVSSNTLIGYMEMFVVVVNICVFMSVTFHDIHCVLHDMQMRTLTQNDFNHCSITGYDFDIHVSSF